MGRVDPGRQFRQPPAAMQRNWGEISLINKTLDKTDNCEPKRKNSETRLTAKLFTWTISSKCFWRFECWTNNTRVSCSSFKSCTAQMRYYLTKSSWMSKVFSFCWLICWKIAKKCSNFPGMKATEEDLGDFENHCSSFYSLPLLSAFREAFWNIFCTIFLFK